MYRQLFSISAGLAFSLLGTSLQAQSWQRITANVPGTLGGGNIGPMATDGTRLYVLGDRGVFMSDNGGSTFTAINSVPGAAYALDRYGLRFVGVANGFVWVGADPGSAAFNDGLATLHRLAPGQTTWTKSSTGFPIGTTGNQADDIAYDATMGTYYVAAALGGAFVSTDGVNWEARNNGNGGLGLPATVETINGVAFVVRPLGGVNKTVDRGLTWTATGAIPGLGSGYLLALNGRVMVATIGFTTLQDGLYYSDDLGVTWSFTQGLAAQYDLTTDGNLVFAAGRGRGAKFSATGGLTWDDLPLTGTAAGFSATRLVRAGNMLFLIGGAAGVTELYRLEVTSYPFNPATQIVRQPTNSPPLLVGDAYSLRVVAGGRNLRYQWRKDGVDVAGATADTLTFASATVANSGSYTVVVTGDFGTLTGATATLNVTARDEGRQDPTFAQLPFLRTGITVVLDDFSVVEFSGNYVVRANQYGARIVDRTFASGRGYNKAIKDSQGRLVLFQGNGNPQVLRLNPATLQDDPAFALPVINGVIGPLVEWPGRGYLAGTAAFASLNGQGLNPIILIRHDGSIDPSFNTGESAFESDSNSPRWLWVSPDGRIYVRYSGPVIRLNPTGEVDASFAPTGLSQLQFVHGLKDGRMLVVLGISSYQVRVLKPDGTFDSTFNPADAKISHIPLAVAEQSDGKLIIGGQFISYGGVTVGRHLRLNADGTLDSTYYNTVAYNGSANVTSLSYDPRGYVYYTPSVTITSATFQNSTSRGTVRVFAHRAPLALFNQTASQRVGQNEGFTLSVNAVGTSANSYQWFKDGVAIAGATSANFTINGFTALNNGSYTVEVKNTSGAATSQPMAMAVIGAPEIQLQPASVERQTGTSHAFSVTAAGAGALSYQWRKNGVNLPGATAGTLTLTNIQFSAEGDYSVVISNAFGSLTSDTATLKVFEITGALIPSFTPGSLDGGIIAMDLMPDGSLLLGGGFPRPGNQNHPWFTRIDTNGVFVPGWTNDPPGGVTAGIGVYCVKALANGQAIIAGQFGRIAGVQRIGFARMNANGTVDETFGHATNGPNSAVYAFEPLPDGKFLVGGIFTQWGTGARLGLARVDANGLLDPSFTIAPNDWVRAIAVLPDGRAYLGGRFATINGQARSSLARLNADGTLDATFVPPTMDGWIYALDLDSAGRIVIGGSFNTVGGLARSKLARLNPDGTLDTTFAPTVSFVNLVGSLDVQLDDKVVVVGNTIARLLPTGATDPTFQLTAGISGGNIGLARTTPAGRMYLTGGFTTPRRYLMAVTTDRADLAITRTPASVAAELGGSATFSVGVFTVSPTTYQWFKNGVLLAGATNTTLTLNGLTKADAGQYTVRVVNATRTITSPAATLTVLAEPVLIEQPLAKSVAVGASVTFAAKAQGAGVLAYQWRKNGVNLAGATADSFTLASAALEDAAIYDVVISNNLGSITSAPAGLGVFAAAGKIDPGFNPGTGPNSTVLASAVLVNGNVAIGGAFSTVNGQARNRFAVLDTNGALVNLASNPSFSQQVTAIAAQPDGKFYVATLVSIGRYHSDGTLDTTFPNLGDQGSAVALRGDQVYFAGYFGGQNPSVRKFNILTGVEDTVFKTNATAIRGFSSYSIYVYADGRVLVGDGNNGVRRLNANGTTDSSFSPPALVNSGGGPRTIYAIQVTEGGAIWICGLFTSVGGQPRNYLSRLNAEGSVDATVPDAGLGRQVNALLLLGNDILVGGDFFPLINGVNYRGFVKVSGTTGLVDPAFGPVLPNPSVKVIAPASNGKVILAGSFTGPPALVARVVAQSDVALAITGQPVGTDVKSGDPAAFTVAWKGGGEAAYQWKKSGQEIAGATGQSFVIGAAAAADAGDYTVTISAGGQTVTSVAATLRVDGSGGTAVIGTFADWRKQFAFPPGQDGENNDADRDGLKNVAEYYFGSHPVDKASVYAPSSAKVIVGGIAYPAVTFVRTKSATGLTLEITVSSIVTFADNLGVTQTTEDLGNGTERVTIRSNVGSVVQPRQFIRVNLRAQP